MSDHEPNRNTACAVLARFAPHNTLTLSLMVGPPAMDNEVEALLVATLGCTTKAEVEAARTPSTKAVFIIVVVVVDFMSSPLGFCGRRWWIAKDTLKEQSREEKRSRSEGARW